MAENSAVPQKVKAISGRLAGDAIIIFLATCFTYISVYAFEAGYCLHFGIPLALIRPDISTVLLFAGTFAAVAWLCFNLALLYPSMHLFFDGIKNPVFRRILITNGPMILFGVLVWLLTGNWGAVVGMFAVVGTFSLLGFVGRGTAEERLRQWDEEVARTSAFPFVAYRRLNELGLAWISTTIVWSFLWLTACISVGQALAKHQKDFLVTEFDGTKAVLRIYSDQWICADVDLLKKTSSHRFMFIKGSESSRIFELRRIGPLKPTGLAESKSK